MKNKQKKKKKKYILSKKDLKVLRKIMIEEQVG